jgi:hypothetical protein
VPEPSEPLFFERGASWYWLLAAPAAALTMVFVQYRAGLGFRAFVPMLFLVMVGGFMALQIKAARTHTSVELTAETLREGTESLAVDDIVAVFPEPDYTVRTAGLMDKWQGRALGVSSTGPLEKWQTSRSLGEINGVPRGRKPVGVKLAGGSYAQAWARDHEGLRAALSRLVESR